MNTRNRRLRQLSIADILDETVEIYKSNFVLLVGISAVLYIPYSLLMQFIPQPRLMQKTFDPGAMIWIALAILLLYVVVNPLVTAALTFAVSERYLDRPASIVECYRRVGKLGVLLPFIGATALTGLIAIAALTLPIVLISMGMALIAAIRTAAAVGAGIALLFAGVAAFALPIWIIMKLVMLAPAYFVESHRPIAAMKRSWNLIKGGMLKAFGAILIAGVVVFLIEGMLSAPTSFVVMRDSMAGSLPGTGVLIVHNVVNGIVSTILMPITSIVVILLYYDLRIRKEGFDLQLLADEIDRRTREIPAQGQEQIPPSSNNTESSEGD
ncbi:MAG: hypothetical protein ABFD49_00480 [Armatimonadota bacterium]|nr:hypothetical protein [bacterium]